MNNEQTIELRRTSFKIFLDSVVTALLRPDTPEEAAALFLSPSVRWHLVTACQEESPKKEAAITAWIPNVCIRISDPKTEWKTS